MTFSIPICATFSKEGVKDISSQFHILLVVLESFAGELNLECKEKMANNVLFLEGTLVNLDYFQKIRKF